MAKILVGERFLLNCGVWVEVIEAKSNDKLIVQSKDGTTKPANATQLRSGSLGWFGKKKAIGATKPKVGDNYTLNCGVEVTIKDYYNCFRIGVEDSQGNYKYVSSEFLRSGEVSWAEFGVSIASMNMPKVGDRFESKRYGWYTVTEVLNTKAIYVTFDNTGRVVKTSNAYVKVGDVSDRGLHRIRALADFEIGVWYLSNKYGRFRILNIPNAADITVEWEDTGNIQRGVRSEKILRKSIVDQKAKESLITPQGCYVYIVRRAGELVYIGKGTGSRFNHVTSGTSHCYDLNRHHFLGDILDIEIYKDSLEEDDSLILEESLIRELKPKYNSTHNRQTQERSSE